MADSAAQFQQALQLRAEGRLEEAIALLESIAAQAPTAANARGMLGLTRCNAGDFERGLADLREAIRIDPRNADVHCNLGVALFAYDRLDEAQTHLRRALALVPAHADALNALSLVLRSHGDFEGAVRAAQRALQLRPDFFQAHVNLAHALLAVGRFADAWKHYSARPHPRVNLRDPHLAVAADHADRLPVRPSPIVLHGEQGLGDTLFFLRFAPALRALGHRLAFWGDPRLHPILARAGIFEHFIHPDSTPAPGLAVIWVGDLPLFLGATDPARFPPALPIATDKKLREAAERRLAAFGPPPYVALTWRAGSPRRGLVALSKNVEPEALGAALAGTKATFVSLQRNPIADEVARLAHAASARIHDASDVNTDLDHALAMLDVVDDYVTVSNTNVHLRASLGHAARVLVPRPPEWRWLESGEKSPWFPSMLTYRQSKTGDWDESLRRLAADLRSANYAEAWSRRGNAFMAHKRAEEALASYERAAQLRPDDAGAIFRRAAVLHELERFDEALAGYREAIRLRPDLADAHGNLAGVLQELGRWDEAAAEFESALRASPDDVNLRWNAGLFSLLRGDYARGWPAYELRWQRADSRFVPHFEQPLWLGKESLAGKTILLHAEQGLGDTLLFSRYVPLVQPLADRVILDVQPALKSLLSSISADVTVIARGEQRPPFDLQCPLGSLPLAFGTSVDTISPPVPLRVPEEKRADWKRRLGNRRIPRIGVSWAGDPANPTDRRRSIPLERLAPLFEEQGFEFHAVQKQLRDGDRGILDRHPQVRAWHAELADFTDTAALLLELDLLVTVDTSIAHVAGSLGMPVWILLARLPGDFRWMVEREDSPWYPSARLFRQQRRNDWEAVVLHLREALRSARLGIPRDM